jgi:hypothetical protein
MEGTLKAVETKKVHEDIEKIKEDGERTSN